MHEIMVFLFMIIAFFVVIFVVAILGAMTPGGKQKAKDRRELVEGVRSARKWDAFYFLGGPVVYPSLKTYLCGVSTGDRILCVGTVGDHQFVPTDTIISVSRDVVEKNRMTGRTSAVAFHGVGVGSTRLAIKGMISDLSLKVVVSNPQEPIFHIDFFL